MKSRLAKASHRTKVAFGVSVYSIKFLMGYVRKHDFKFFGYYRIVLGIVVLSYFGIFGASRLKMYARSRSCTLLLRLGGKIREHIK